MFSNITSGAASPDYYWKGGQPNNVYVILAHLRLALFP